MTVFVTNKTRFKISPHLIEKAFKNTLKITKKRIRKNLSVVIVNNKEIKKINKLYRQKERATDVLTFSFLGRDKHFQVMEDVIGEIFISAEMAKKQAQEASSSFKKEIILLFVHGFLHILGYNHKTRKEAFKMRKLEEKILSEVID